MNTSFAIEPEADRRYMALALRLGRRVLGATAENPAVGCIVVDSDKGLIVSRGWTGIGGRPHAEQIALERAGDDARGKTVYVSLEPCAHHGRTPPCTEGLVAARVRRVVTAMEDPDPRVSGRGHDMLRQSGIMVDVGVGADEAAYDLSGFLSRMRRGRPHVTIKLAMSTDGKIAARPGERTAITGPQAQARSHLMRAQADAIMVGRRTIEIDDPLLTCRLPGLERRSPVRVVLSTDGSIPNKARMLATAMDVPVVILSAAAPDRSFSPLHGQPGVTVIGCGAGPDGRTDLLVGLRALGALGINRILVEGGAQVAARLVAEDLADEVAFFTAPDLLGECGVEALAATPLDAITSSGRFTLVEEDVFGIDRLQVFWRHREG